MREDVLSLRAMGGDPVSEEYLKAGLYHRAEALKDIPDAPLFFGRLDYASQHGASQHGADLPAETEDGVAGHSFHIGRRHVHAPDGTPAAIDWRAPVSRPFYRASAADPMNLALRRRFGFSGGELTAYEDELLGASAASEAGAPAAALGQALVTACRQACSRPGSVGVIAADPQVPALGRALEAAGMAYGAPGADSALTLVPVTLAKGLEYDHVVVVEPARIAGAEARGLQRLYVALTRAVSRLTVLYSEPLPDPLPD